MQEIETKFVKSNAEQMKINQQLLDGISNLQKEVQDLTVYKTEVYHELAKMPFFKNRGNWMAWISLCNDCSDKVSGNLNPIL